LSSDILYKHSSVLLKLKPLKFIFAKRQVSTSEILLQNVDSFWQIRNPSLVIHGTFL
jgi:hypothetical protein